MIINEKNIAYAKNKWISINYLFFSKRKNQHIFTYLVSIGFPNKNISNKFHLIGLNFMRYQDVKQNLSIDKNYFIGISYF